jgi:glucan phosphoethanolaminetransferase (alkaline phosphatase superfamily)
MAHSSSHSQDPAPTAKRLAWLSGILCVLCCTIPILGVAVGSATLAGAAAFFESAAAAFVAAAGVLLAVWLYRRRRAPACHLHCGCKAHWRG